ncbi:MAG: UDP-N-acetylmuramate dehydrogenase [Acidaminococcaceae bacterium]|nr:UDP-N-acetylmuramate dehydrogenase [Acidaminococcaceae bacterium]MDD4722222.1 UDP-N-acetylmuramate dehydrogenase [Acidaminococcaceae bacterium]
MDKFCAWLHENMPGRYYLQEPMKNHTSFHIGGPADLLVMPKDVEELRQLLLCISLEKLPLTILGNGSNILVKDNGVRGVVIKLGNALRKVECNGNFIVADAGVSLAAVANKAASFNLTGLEFAVGIPGSLGGAVFMNAGAYDGEMKNVVKSVTVMYIKDGSSKVIKGKNLDFGYRHSAIQAMDCVITEINMKLVSGKPEAIKQKMADFTDSRVTKQPLDLPNAGSMFKRPHGYYAGTLIEEAGLKGYTVGGAQVSEKHAGFVVNIGNATASDVLQLMKDVQDRVYEYSRVHLEPEVRVIGD